MSVLQGLPTDLLIVIVRVQYFVMSNREDRKGAKSEGASYPIASYSL